MSKGSRFEVFKASVPMLETYVSWLLALYLAPFREHVSLSPLSVGVLFAYLRTWDHRSQKTSYQSNPKRTYRLAYGGIWSDLSVKS
jgi:hypothetical protein